MIFRACSSNNPAAKPRLSLAGPRTCLSQTIHWPCVALFLKTKRDTVGWSFICLSPSACVSTSAEESHPLNSPALLATILNDVFTFGIGLASLNLHCLFAYDAVQETCERAFIVVRMMSRATHFPCAPQPDLDHAAAVAWLKSAHSPSPSVGQSDPRGIRTGPW